MMRGFHPVSALWEGDNPAYPSEQSALWAVRQMRQQLADAEAIAFHRGRTMVDLEKVAEIARQRAIEKAKKRWGGAVET